MNLDYCYKICQKGKKAGKEFQKIVIQYLMLQVIFGPLLKIVLKLVHIKMNTLRRKKKSE